MAAMRNALYSFLRLNRFPLKNGTFNFGTRIGHANYRLIFYYFSHKYRFGEAI